MFKIKRTKLADRKLPTYTKGEEIFNMVTHIVGGGLGFIGLILCVTFAVMHHNGYAVFSGIVFGISMIVLYTMSSIYHGLSPNLKGKKVMQVLDHCTIFILIAGCYTPFALVTFRQYDPVFGWGLFIFIWLVSALGITLNAIDLRKYRVFSMICYITLGWCIIIKAYLLPTLLGWNGTILLVSGGIVYTLSTIFYGVGRKVKYMHSIFHLMIVIANILQFLCILLYVM